MTERPTNSLRRIPTQPYHPTGDDASETQCVGPWALARSQLPVGVAGKLANWQLRDQKKEKQKEE